MSGFFSLIFCQVDYAISGSAWLAVKYFQFSRRFQTVKKSMRKMLIFMIAALLMNVVLADPVPPRLMRNLKGNHIMRASLQKGELRLVTTHAAITPEIHETTVLRSACAVLLADPEKGWEKAWIDRIRVMNRDDSQGYVLVDARNSCLELGWENPERQGYFSGKVGNCTKTICENPVPAGKTKVKKQPVPVGAPGS